MEDKKGQPVKEDDVIFDGKIYWRVIYHEPTNEWNLVSSELELIQCPDQEILNQFERVGVLEDYKEFFNC